MTEPRFKPGNETLNGQAAGSSFAPQISDEAAEIGATALDAYGLTSGDAYDAASDVLQAAVPLLYQQWEAERLETRLEYGHQTAELGWIPEPRGINHAAHQRTVHYRCDEPVSIDHWTYTDHRHPVEGCTHDRHDLTTEAAVARGVQPGGQQDG